jgi:hypothetical protein
MVAPIVVFAYRRPEHLRRTLSSLMQCDGFAGTPVIIYGDGPRNAEDIPGVEATRRLARDMLGTAAEYHFSEFNQGLSRSIIAGVGAVTRRFGRAIVVEDDLLLAPGFLAYMNAALDHYADHHAVFQVSGYMFDVPEFAKRRDALFLPFTVSWGWATWKRAWDRFDSSATGWDRLLVDNVLRKRFDIDGNYRFSTMLVQQMIGRRDSWAIRWYWTAFQNDALTIFPPKTLVTNIGFDGTGSHGRGVLRSFGGESAKWPDTQVILPSRVILDNDNYALVKDSIRRANGRWLGAAIDNIRWIITKAVASRYKTR